jgi:hypothetical protein
LISNLGEAGRGPYRAYYKALMPNRFHNFGMMDLVVKEESTSGLVV